jgi:glutathione synthase/RimK-type ligase-like ATP-grasp enzyme
MKIAIHSSPVSYSNKWEKYCREKDIHYKIVNCHSNDIISEISDCDALMWHFHHQSPKDFLIAKQILYAVELSGKKVYPDINSFFFFDDKVGQKYLFEAIGAPLATSYVFVEKSEALEWVKKTSFPKVFKLRKGSGSANVKLVKTKRQANKLIRKAFRSGFRLYNPSHGLKERYRMYSLGKSNIKDLLEGLGRYFLKTRFERIAGKERGYVYFQDFIPDCLFDIRTTVVWDKCFVFKRKTRDNDFRASGSHQEIYNTDGIPLEVIKLSFSICNRLKLQTAAFDFLLNKDGKAQITEFSYAFGWDEGDCYGYFDTELNWYDGDFNPIGYMVERIIE